MTPTFVLRQALQQFASLTGRKWKSKGGGQMTPMLQLREELAGVEDALHLVHTAHEQHALFKRRTAITEAMREIEVCAGGAAAGAIWARDKIRHSGASDIGARLAAGVYLHQRCRGYTVSEKSLAERNFVHAAKLTMQVLAGAVTEGASGRS